MRGTPVTAPCAGYGVLYLWQSSRLPWLVILPALLLIAAAVLSTSYFRLYF